MNNQEEIIGSVNELRENSYSKNIYAHWLALITNKNNILFIRACSSKQVYFKGGGTPEEYKILEDLNNETLGQKLEKVMRLENKKIFIIKENLNGIIFSGNRIILKDEAENIELKTYKKQKNIIQRILQNNLNYEEALKNSGIDFTRIVLLVFIVAAIAFAIFMHYYFSKL